MGKTVKHCMLISKISLKKSGKFYCILVHFVHLETAGGIAGLLHRLYRQKLAIGGVGGQAEGGQAVVSCTNKSVSFAFFSDHGYLKIE